MNVANKNLIDSTDLYASAEKIYPRQVSGTFAKLRVASVWVLLGTYYLVPWLQWNGKQAILFDLPARQFNLFGVTLWPQDFVLLTLLLIVAALSLFFFTALAGRLWCGYACPQTVWTESFMWMERLIEGDRNKRMKLDKAPWSVHKVVKKLSKHSVWLTFALFTGFTFVGYFSPIRELTVNTLEWQLGGWEVFWVLFYSLATYGNAGWLREQVCLYMCPYARFQSAMFDKDTLIISYDKERGEPRGKRKKTADLATLGLGECIDCNQCVHVCPTGIDIRDGLQYECIGCAGCIDVCDSVMEQMGYPTGLVRYTTEHALEGKPTKVFRLRTLIYGTILASLFGVLIASLFLRNPLELDIIRDRAGLYNETFSGLIENVYTLKILNMDQSAHRYELTVSGVEGMKILGDLEFQLAGGEVLNVPVRVQIAPESLQGVRTDIDFTVQSIDKPGVNVTETNRFIGPTSK